MDAARQRAGGLLDPYHAVAVPFRKGTTQLYRARFRGFDATAATSTCLHLRRLQIDCFVVSAE
jgi:D-alanyl-D-alanine carboxypeptidase